MDKQTITTQLIAEVARIIGLPIIPMAPTAVHDSKPFPHLVQHGNGKGDGPLFLDGQLFDPLTNGRDFLLVEAWLERNGIAYEHGFYPMTQTHLFNIDDSHWQQMKTRPLAGCFALINQYGDGRLIESFILENMKVPA